MSDVINIRTYYCKKCEFETTTYARLSSHRVVTGHIGYTFTRKPEKTSSEDEIAKIRKRNGITPNNRNGRRPLTKPIYIPIPTQVSFAKRCTKLKRPMWKLADEIFLSFLKRGTMINILKKEIEWHKNNTIGGHTRTFMNGMVAGLEQAVKQQKLNHNKHTK